MRTCKSLFFLLCSCILLFMIFSRKALADESSDSIVLDELTFTHSGHFYNSSQRLDEVLLFPSSGFVQYGTISQKYKDIVGGYEGTKLKYGPVATHKSSNGNLCYSADRSWIERIKISSDAGVPIMLQGEVYDIRISNLYMYFEDVFGSLYSYNPDGVYLVNFFYEDFDGNRATIALEKSQYVLEYLYNSEMSITVDLTEEDFSDMPVRAIGIELCSLVRDAYYGWENAVSGYITYGFSSGFEAVVTKSTVVSDDEDKNIIDGIIDGIGGFFDDLGDGLAGIGESIANFPSLVLDGVKGLFVPDQEAFTDIKDQYDTMLRDRLGALYAGFDIVFVVAESISSADPTTTVYFPEVNIPLVGETFSFGGYDVELVPSGFEGLIDSLKVIVNIICTLLLLNALKNRFMNLLGDRGGGEE